MANYTTTLVEKLGIGKNIITRCLNELESKGHIRFIGKTLVITSPHFPLSVKNDYDNSIYNEIYKFCLFKNKVPPIRNKTAMDCLTVHYTCYIDKLIQDLNKKCGKLPESLQLNYFCQALLNKIPSKTEITTTSFYL